MRGTRQRDRIGFCGPVDSTGHRTFRGGGATGSPELLVRGLSSRGEVAHHPGQPVSAHGPSDAARSEVDLVIPTLSIHTTDRIERVPRIAKSGNVVAAVVGHAAVGAAGFVGPVQLPVPDRNALAEEYSEIEDDVEATQFFRPRHRELKERLAGRLLAKARNEGAAVPGTPGRDRSKSGLVDVATDVEPGKKRGQRGAPHITAFHEIAEVLSSALQEFFEQALVLGLAPALKTARKVRALPIRRVVDRIVRQRLGHLPPTFGERCRFATQPTEHGYLRC